MITSTYSLSTSTKRKIYQESAVIVPAEPLVYILHRRPHQQYILHCSIADYLLHHVQVSDLEGGGSVDDLRYFLYEFSALNFSLVVDDHGLAATFSLSHCLQRTLHIPIDFHFCIG